MVCDDEGITLKTVPLAKSYWRVDSTSSTFLTCKHESACKGEGRLFGNVHEMEAAHTPKSPSLTTRTV